MHANRHVDFRRGLRLGKYDHLITWQKPPRPDWMDRKTYALLPKTLTLREIRYNVIEPGKRTEKLTVVTTLIDPDNYSKEDLAELYHFRWNAELDIRSIKQTLNLDHVRCQSPGMVRREVWTTLLAYNLIRTTAAAAALLHDKPPREISFTATCQYVLSCWSDLRGLACESAERFRYCRAMLAQIAQCLVARRPGRIEPRVIKRRRHRYPGLTKILNLGQLGEVCLEMLLRTFLLELNGKSTQAKERSSDGIIQEISVTVQHGGV